MKQKLQKNLAVLALVIVFITLALSGGETKEPTPAESAVIRWVTASYSGSESDMKLALAESSEARSGLKSLSKVLAAIAEARGGLKSVSAEELRTVGAAPSADARRSVRWRAVFGTGDESEGVAEAVEENGRWLVDVPEKTGVQP